MLADYKRQFIDFAIDQGVLNFGEFELKSGRISPYFFNAGEFKTGGALHRLGEYYAEALVASEIPVDCLFGPAYKGIPLVCATAIALAERHQLDIPYGFNRKEVKDHGEGGMLVGAEPGGDLVIVEDVITAGTAIREVMTMMESLAVNVRGVMVAFDRQERGKGDLSAIQEVERDYELSVVSIVNLDDIVLYLGEKDSFGLELEQISTYRSHYGIAS